MASRCLNCHHRKQERNWRVRTRKQMMIRSSLNQLSSARSNSRRKKSRKRTKNRRKKMRMKRSPIKRYLPKTKKDW